MSTILVIGTGGLAREFTAWFSAQHLICGYASSNREEHAQFELPGVLFDEDVSPEAAGTDLAVVTVAAPTAKAALYQAFSQRGFCFPAFVHGSSVIAESASIGEGVVVSPQCVISANVLLEKFAYINFGCGVGHDAQLGSFSQLNPGVQLGGQVILGSGVLVGSSATVLQKVTVGDAATIASGAAVFSRVAAGATVMGNPAKRMRAFEE